MATIAALGLIGAPSVRSQTLSSDWRAFNGGGGVSTADSVTLIGSLGNLETARVTAGDVVIVNGFLGDDFEIPAVKAPVIAITSGADGKVTLSWSPLSPPFILQFTDTLSPALWQDASSGSANPVQIVLSSSTRFFRLRTALARP